MKTTALLANKYAEIIQNFSTKNKIIFIFASLKIKAY